MDIIPQGSNLYRKDIDLKDEKEIILNHEP